MLASNAFIPNYGSISPFFAILILERMEFAYVLNVLERVKHIRYGHDASKPEGCHHPAKMKCKNTRWLFKATLNFHGDI